MESNWLFGLLFLRNNPHIVHCLHPTMAWFDITGFWTRNRQKLLHVNGNFISSGYFAIARQSLLRPVFLPVHPVH